MTPLHARWRLATHWKSLIDLLPLQVTLPTHARAALALLRLPQHTSRAIPLLPTLLGILIIDTSAPEPRQQSTSFLLLPLRYCFWRRLVI